MDDLARALKKRLPDHLTERIRVINRRPVNRSGRFVLYWMHHAVRGHENPALDVAVIAANELRLPVLVYQGLGGRNPYNSDRHFTFIMEGAIDARAELTERGVTHLFNLSFDPEHPSPLGGLIEQSALTLTEDFPAPPINRWIFQLARNAPIAFWAVDTACVVPMQLHESAIGRAYLFRNQTQRLFRERLLSVYEPPMALYGPAESPTGVEDIDLASEDMAALIARCAIDHTVGPVSGTRGGAKWGYERWKQFKDNGLASYQELRNDAAIAFPMGVSRISPYLHHGHVSPFRIAREAAEGGNPGSDKFLDELLIWRELAHNFCFFHPRPDRLDVLPEWALQTLNDHRHDRRKAIYSWEALAMGDTGNPIWDAAQASLRVHGELHNNLRMTWGKALLQWTRSPEEALATMIDLNHRYALDGSDPNSYGGILWCLGLFDRPFNPEREIIGRLRPRSTRSHAKRLDLTSYADRVKRPAGKPPLRIAVIGAGLSGVVAARTLAGHGHQVQIFEKARGAGGRMTTRRAEGYAFDHGAQYFTARDPHFRRRVTQWEKAGIVKPWNGRIRVIRQGEMRPEKKKHLRYVGVPGMSAVARHLCKGLDVAWSTRVDSIRRVNHQMMLVDENGHDSGGYDIVVTSAPAEQSAQLLAGRTHLYERLSGIRMTPCWAVMLGFEAFLNLPFDGAFVHDSALSWAARNSSKSGRGELQTWVLHANAAWSAEHYDHDAQDVIQRLTAEFFSAVQSPAVEPVFSSAHRWRYAQAENPLMDGALWDPNAMIGSCGDWCAGSRVEGAYLSGAAMAGKILAHIHNRI